MPSNHGLDTGAVVARGRVQPRDAASLVVVRGTGKRAEVLLGRRAPRHAFMPDVYVFPGGGIQSEDQRGVPVRALPAPERARMRPRGAERLSDALAAAAARETFEETGLIFGALEDGVLRPDLSAFVYLGRAITPVFSPIRFHARFFLADAEQASGQLGGSGELLDLCWVRIDQALAMPVIDVTEIMLHETARLMRGEPPRAPFVHYRGEEVLVSHE